LSIQKQAYHFLQNNLWTQQKYQKHILSLLSYTNYADTKALRTKLFETLSVLAPLSVKKTRIIISGSNRVNCGGSWNNTARNSRSSVRNNNTPDNSINNIGFRLCH